MLWHDKQQSNLAIIRIGSGKSTLFPVTLSQTGGEQGDHEKAASWAYTVTDALSDEELEKNVDPTASPHRWKRPGLSASLLSMTCGWQLKSAARGREKMQRWVDGILSIYPLSSP